MYASIWNLQTRSNGRLLLCCELGDGEERVQILTPRRRIGTYKDKKNAKARTVARWGKLREKLKIYEKFRREI
jgi:hypothetical protein